MGLSDDQLSTLRSFGHEGKASPKAVSSPWSVLAQVIVVAALLGAVRVAASLQVPHANTAWLFCRYALAAAGTVTMWLLLWTTLFSRSGYTFLIDLVWTAALVWIAIPAPAVAWMSAWTSSAPAWQLAAFVIAFVAGPFALGAGSISFVAELEFRRILLRASFAGIAAVIAHVLGKRVEPEGHPNPDVPPVGESSDILLKNTVVTDTATGAWKTCPDCAEAVRAKARVCRFCRHSFDKEPT